MQHRYRTVAITIAAIAALASTAVAAQAAEEIARDGDDSSIAADIKRVRVVHDETLRVRIKAEDLKRSSRRVQGAVVYVDTRRSRPGPERMIEMGLWKDADYVVTKARRWHRTGGDLQCDSSLTVNYRNDWATVELSPDCLGGKHRKVRVAVVTFERIKKKPYTGSDWLTETRTFTSWVKRG